MIRQEIPAHHLAHALGALPDGPGPRAVWCSLAEEVEQFRDRHPGAWTKRWSAGVSPAFTPTGSSSLIC
jgi:hypothetical protein